jgi:hypothetical protein
MFVEEFIKFEGIGAMMKLAIITEGNILVRPFIDFLGRLP